MREDKLAYGYNEGFPEGVLAGWGARWIVTQDGYVDFVPDRQDMFYETIGQRDALIDYLNAIVGNKPNDTARDLLRNGTMQTRESGEFVLYQDTECTVKGNTKASAGYLYVCGWLHEHKPCPARSDGHCPCFEDRGTCCACFRSKELSDHGDGSKAEQLLIKAQNAGKIGDDDWQASNDGEFFLVDLKDGRGSIEYTADEIARLLEEFFKRTEK